jgi:hypothetical protein
MCINQSHAGNKIEGQPVASLVPVVDLAGSDFGIPVWREKVGVQILRVGAPLQHNACRTCATNYEVKMCYFVHGLSVSDIEMVLFTHTQPHIYRTHKRAQTQTYTHTHNHDMKESMYHSLPGLSIGDMAIVFWNLSLGLISQSRS